MDTAHINRQPASISHRDWQGPIQLAMDLDQLVAIVRAYLAAWPPEKLRALPTEVAATTLSNSEAIVAGAVMASQAELKLKGDEPGYGPLREMALTLGAAAARMRYLHALRSSL